MLNREFAVRPPVLDWLLEANNPSVRHFALTELLNRPESDKDVRESKKSIMKSRLVSKILCSQKTEGYWETPDGFYTPKYRATVWQLLILGELGANGNDRRIRNACEFILGRSQDQVSGGFSIQGNLKTGGSHGGVIPCLTGNLLWSLLRFGYCDDSRVQHGIDWVTAHQRFDDGIDAAPAGWPTTNGRYAGVNTPATWVS